MHNYIAMRILLLVLFLCNVRISFAQTPTVIEPGEKLNSVWQKLKSGYTTQIGWTIQEGDTVTIGKSSNYNKSFAFIYLSPANWTTAFSAPGAIPNKQCLPSRLAGRSGYVKEIRPIGARRAGYTIVAVIGIGEMANYWIEIDNALEGGEIIPPKGFVDKRAKKNEISSVVGNQKLSVADELKKLKDLLDQGIINQEEFDIQKKKLLEQ